MKKFCFAVLMVVFMSLTLNEIEDDTDKEEENKELLKNLCWTVDDSTGPEGMDETFWRIFLRSTYGAGWWREMEGVSISRLNYSNSNTEYVHKVSYEEVETYTQLVFGIEWPGIKSPTAPAP